jgi:hypothetical protein
MKAPRLYAKDRKKVNAELHDLTFNRYFAEIPLEEVMGILSRHGMVIIQEDFTEWSGFLCGREGTALFDLAPCETATEAEWGTCYKAYHNAGLILQWYQMVSGRYEMLTYIG